MSQNDTKKLKNGIMMKKLLFAIAAVCAAAAVSAQGEILRLHLKKGDVFNQRMNTVSDVTQNLFGQQVEMKNEMTGELRYEIVAVENGNYVMDVSYTKLEMSVKSPMTQTNMSGSSDTPGADNLFSPMLSAMTGKTFRVTMTPSGRTVSVEGMEKIFDAILEQDSFSSLPPEAAEQLLKQIKNSYGGDSFKSNMQTGMAAFPETPVSVGDSWTEESHIKTGIDMNMRIKYTLTGKTADHILITAETEIETGGEPAEMNGIAVLYKLKGNMASEIRLNHKTLWTEYSAGKMNMEGTIVIPKSEQVPTDMTIPLTMQTTSSYEAF